MTCFRIAIVSIINIPFECKYIYVDVCRSVCVWVCLWVCVCVCVEGGSLTLLVGGTQWPHPLALDTTYLAQSAIAHGSNFARKTDFGYFGELLQYIDLFLLLLILIELGVIGVDGRIAGLLIIDAYNWGEIGTEQVRAL